MSKLKLTYFDFPGSRGEECRLALSVAQVEFEDERIPGFNWPSLKPTTPFGALPVLEEDGRQPLSQTNAILSLIGRRYGLLPVGDDWETARLSSLMCAAEEFRTAVSKTFEIKDPEEVKQARHELVEGPLKTWGKNMEAQLKGPFAGGEKMSVADIKVHVIVGWIKKGVLDHVSPDSFDDFPKLIAVFEGVQNHPQVAAWYKKHGPKS